jgi:arginine utilization protein RocB
MCVLTYAELCERAGLDTSTDPLVLAAERGASPGDRRAADACDPASSPDPRAATLARLRELSRRAGLGGPAVVLFLLPPFYPHAAPGIGPVVRATREVLEAERDVLVKPYYPLVSDACYAAWRSEPLTEVARQMPSLGREYDLPYDDATALDLDVVNLGPWGHDLHGLLERAHAGWTFERLPKLIWKVLDRMCEFAPPGGSAT